MLYAEICRVLGKYFLALAAILVIPLAVSILYEFFLDDKIYLQNYASAAFLETLGISLFTSLILSFIGRSAKGVLYKKESILLVVLIWLLTALICSLPFLFSGVMENPLDAFFESMSGLTTTGASIIYPKAYDPATGLEVPITMQNVYDPSLSYTFYGTVAPLKDTESGVILHQGIEALGKPLLFWRSLLQWLGGIGIVVLFIAFLPIFSGGGKFLYESEVSGPHKEGMKPRIKETAGFLWKIYLGLSVIQVMLLKATNWNMSFFDAITLTFSTISTGGFTTSNEGLLEHQSLATLWIIIVFMILGGLNFSLFFYCFKRQFERLYDPELFFYIFSLIIGSFLIGLGIWHLPQLMSFQTSMFDSTFQAVSAQTSTGFSIVNYDQWPIAYQLLMIFLMYIGGMSGSTAGGIKVIRYVIACKVISHKLQSFLRSGVVHVIKVGNKEITAQTALSTMTFFCMTLFISLLGIFLLCLDNHDLITAAGLISTTITNTGLYFGGIGSMESLGYLSNYSKVIGILWMLLGRLEFFALLVLLLPSFWRK